MSSKNCLAIRNKFSIKISNLMEQQIERYDKDLNWLFIFISWAQIEKPLEDDINKE